MLVASGCASSGSLFLKPTASAGEPWVISTDAYPTQRLYRVKYDGPQGEAGFKLVLYLENATRYRMLATDLGRKLWSLDVDGGGEATWIDFRRKEYCRAGAAGELRFVPLADLPLLAMPKLLLGLIPAEPAANLNQSADGVTFLDARGYLWNGGLAAERLEWWSRVEAGEPVIWWRREAGGGLFIDRRGEQQVRWSEIVRETLGAPLAAAAIPSRYRLGACGSAAAR